MKVQFITLAALLLMVSACSKNRLMGEGTIISDTRTVAPFDKIDCNGNSEIRVFHDSAYRVVVSGYQNLVPAYNTEVSGNTLRLQYDEDYFNVRNDNVSVDVYTPNLRNVTLDGSGNVQINSGFEGVFGGEINGSGNMSLADANFTSASYRINGSGNIKAQKAVADTAHAVISGSGNIELRVTHYLIARISGSGNIDYWGNPVADINISGSGKIKKR